MKPLPVPPLRQTLDRYLEAVEPLLTDDELATTRAAVEQFATGEGPAAQAALEQLAAKEDALGRSWLSEAWLEGYNATRDPLPLVSNVGFEVVIPGAGTGLQRAAEITHRMASAYLAFLRGERHEDVSPRGEPLAQDGYLLMGGGIREPRLGLDEFALGSQNPADREVVVLWRGAAVALRVSDGEGQPLSVAAIRKGLEQVVTHGDDTFTAPAYLPNDEAAHIVDVLRADPANGATYDRLREALFCVGLTDEATELHRHMERVAFASGQVWPFKPLTLQIGIADDFLGLHLEHSTLDGSTLVVVLQLAQGVTPAMGSDADEAAAVEPMRWALDAALTDRLARGVATYEARAARMRTRIVQVPVRPMPATPFKVSLDACIQLVMLYAQVATYGRVRSTYESVDMREYQAGRTECLRPNTSAAVALARALVDGTATTEQLVAHLEGHREQVKRCKSGNGIDRHLFGLRMMATRGGHHAPLFDDPAYARLTTDFMSTTSLGETSRIVRAAFAPTSPGGVGIYYVPNGGVLDFTVTVDRDLAERVDELEANLGRGAAALWELLERSAG